MIYLYHAVFPINRICIRLGFSWSLATLPGASAEFFLWIYLVPTEKFLTAINTTFFASFSGLPLDVMRWEKRSNYSSVR